MIAHVALPVPIFKVFTYRIPPPLEPFVQVRVRVRVPFANRSLIGFVVGIEEEKEECPFTPSDIREVADLEPLVDPISFDLCLWAARHYCVSPGLALKTSFLHGSDLERYLVVGAQGDDPLGVDGLRLKRAYTLVGKERVWEHYHQGLFRVRDVFTGESLKQKGPSVSVQRFSAKLFVSQAESRREYYLSMAAPLLESGSNVLILLPDRGLAGGYFHRFFEEKLGERVLYFGSHMPAKRKGEVYFRTRNQGGYLVIGTRSCLFLPTHNTRLIIVERPEDDGYRNDQALQFDGVALATKLAELRGVPILYGSVSPPLDVMKGVEEGIVESIGGEPVTTKPVEVAAVKRFRIGQSPPQELMDILAEGLSRDERIVIHTPLKDYAARLYCLSCHQSILCPVCESAVSFRKDDNRLVCWKCGRQFPYHERCTHCGSELISFGSTGAEYMEEHIRSAMADASVLKITGETVRSKKDIGQLMGLVGEPRTIIVGTRVLSKLYEVGPIGRLILVGWEDFMRIAGYRAREYIRQTYCNLIDALRPAKVYLLTTGKAREPEEVLTMNDEDFYSQELERRKTAEFPPYVRLFLLKIDSSNRPAALSAATRLRGLLEAYGIGDNIVGETVRPGEKGHLAILLKGRESLLDGLLPELTRVRHLRIEADPPWV
ncbi:MAG TPA: hypothetical protein DCR97_02555 [Deltaproteobacteria bacterium]|nr:hypothetical protein [Deltaproteobacteria bacterium]